MSQILINSLLRNETRIAIVDKGKLNNYWTERYVNPELRGSIYLGRVTSVNQNLNAVFVDIGKEKNGFLPLRDDQREGVSLTGDNKINEGDQILVQIRHSNRDPSKGERLTTLINLISYSVILLPESKGELKVAQVRDQQRRQRIVEIGKRLELPDQYGFMLRNLNRSTTVSDVQSEVDDLVKTWEEIHAKSKILTPPALLYLDGTLVERTIRDYFRPNISQIVTDDEAMHKYICELVDLYTPERGEDVKLLDTEKNIFQTYSISNELDAMSNRTVALKSGGSIVIDQTEAMTTIDINSSSASSGPNKQLPIDTNLEAAQEIARLLPIRDIGGLVVIDFIDMETDEEKESVLKEMEKWTSTDRARVECLPISKFGLMELTRQRIGQQAGISAAEVCSNCSGTGWATDNYGRALNVLYTITDQIIKENRKTQGKRWQYNVQVSGTIANLINNDMRITLNHLIERYDTDIRILANPSFSPTDVKIQTVESDMDINGILLPTSDKVTLDSGIVSVDESAVQSRPKAAIDGLQKTPRTRSHKHPKRKSAKTGENLIVKFIKSLFGPSDTKKSTRSKKSANRRSNTPHRQHSKSSALASNSNLRHNPKRSGERKPRNERNHTGKGGFNTSGPRRNRGQNQRDVGDTSKPKNPSISDAAGQEKASKDNKTLVKPMAGQNESKNVAKKTSESNVKTEPNIKPNGSDTPLKVTAQPSAVPEAVKANTELKDKPEISPVTKKPQTAPELTPVPVSNKPMESMAADTKASVTGPTLQKKKSPSSI